MTSLQSAKKFFTNHTLRGHSEICSRKVVMPEIERSPHDASSVSSNAPAPGSWNFGDQTMSAEAPKDPADSGAGLLGIVDAIAQMRRCGQPLADIPVAETADAVIAVHDTLEQFGVTPRQRIETRTASSGRILFSSREPVHFAFRLGGVIDDSQRF
jgi:hypothetical protein